jgi:hypothetical protein
MTVTERRSAGVVRGVLVAMAGVMLALVLAVPSAAAQEDYPGGGADQPPAVAGETVFQGGAPDPSTSGGGFAVTGSEILLLVTVGASLVGVGLWLHRRGRSAAQTRT